MREILFRGKRVDNGEWVQGSLFAEGTRFEIVRSTCNNVGIEGIDVIPETIGQYTGLTDKNGQKIFEGDICQHRSYYSDNIVISVVTYTDGQFLVMVDENSGFNLSDKLEIIGNIHDNPELLGGGSDA